MIKQKYIFDDREYSVFHSDSNNISEILGLCIAEGFEPLSMPQLADLMINNPNCSAFWEMAISTTSIIANGKTKAGNEVIAIAHCPSYLSSPKNLYHAIRENQVSHGAVCIPDEEFWKILELEDNVNVFVVDRALVEQWPKEFYGVDAPLVKEKIAGLDAIAINHPLTAPYFASRERAEKFLKKHRDICSGNIEINTIPLWADKPLASLIISFYVGINNYSQGPGPSALYSKIGTAIGRKP